MVFTSQEVFPSEGFLGESVVKNPPANSGDTSSIPGLGRSPGEGNGNPFRYSLGNRMDKKSLVGCSPWGHRRIRHNLETEPDTTSL